MKHAIPCTIETITAPGEDAWIITIDAVAVPDAIIYLTALQCGKITQFQLADHNRSAVMEPGRLLLEGFPVRITADWLEAILSMLLNIHLNGRTHPAHLDQDFPISGGEITVCIAVASPRN